MKSLDVFLPWVLPYAPACTDGLAKQMVLDACIDLCARTSLIQEVDVQDIVADQAEYTVGAPSQQRLTKVLKVFVGATEIKPVALDDVRHGAAARAATDTVVLSDSGTPSFFHQTTPSDDAIYLWPVPSTSTTSGLAIRAAFEPTRTATQVADDLFDDYALTIAYGALSRLLGIVSQPFYNPQQAAAFQRQFDSELSRAIGQATRGTTRGSLRVQPRAFA